MADGGNDGRGEGAFFKRSSRGCAADSTAASDGGVRGDGTRLCRRATREQFQYGIRHTRGQIAVSFGAARLPALASGGAPIGVIEAFFLSALERSFLTKMPWRS
jgi:hypothetical protein